MSRIKTYLNPEQKAQMKGMTREQKVEFKRKVRVEHMINTCGYYIDNDYTLQDLTQSLGTIEA